MNNLDAKLEEIISFLAENVENDDIFDLLIEEPAELQKAVIHLKRTDRPEPIEDRLGNFIEELADVLLVALVAAKKTGDSIIASRLLLKAQRWMHRKFPDSPSQLLHPITPRKG